MIAPSRLTRVLSELAREKGYQVGVAPAAPAPSAERLRSWLDAGMHGELDWMERNAERRTDPAVVVPGARSLVAFATSYRTETPPPDDLLRAELRGRIARYAWNRDYHDVLTPEIRDVMSAVDREAGGTSNRSYVDTGPVLERDVASRTGLGFVSKNTNLIRPGDGSFLFLGGGITTAELAPTEGDLRPGCGTCRICLDACPTGAIVAPQVVDARLCISYLTIELRGVIPRKLRRAIGSWVFGCDVCQDVCPWNESPGETAREEFRPASLDAMAPSLVELLALDDEGFRRRFRGTPLLRTKRRGVLRNAAVALGNHRDPRGTPPLVAALADAESLVRAHAAWGLGEIASAGDAGARSALERARVREEDVTVRDEIEVALQMC